MENSKKTLVDVWDGEWEKYSIEECKKAFRTTDTEQIDFTKIESIFINGDVITIAYKNYTGIPEESEIKYKQNNCSGVYVKII